MEPNDPQELLVFMLLFIELFSSLFFVYVLMLLFTFMLLLRQCVVVELQQEPPADGNDKGKDKGKDKGNSINDGHDDDDDDESDESSSDDEDRLLACVVFLCHVYGCRCVVLVLCVLFFAVG